MKTDYERGWEAARASASEAIVSYDRIDLMTPPSSPLFQLLFDLKARVEAIEFPHEGLL